MYHQAETEGTMGFLVTGLLALGVVFAVVLAASGLAVWIGKQRSR